MAVYKLAGGAGSIILSDERGDATRVIAPNSILTIGRPEHIKILDDLCRAGAAEQIEVDEISAKADRPNTSSIIATGKVRV